MVNLFGKKVMVLFLMLKVKKDAVTQYILNQKIIIKREVSREEYLDFLEKFDINYDEKYLFEFYDKLE